MDRIIQCHDLAGGIQQTPQKVGIEKDISLPSKQLKQGYRNDRRRYREVLSDADAELIARVCREEIAAFGYQF